MDDFAGFFHNFCPSGEEYQDYNCRLVWWIRVTDTCNDEPQRVLYQRFYLEHFVPQTFRWRLSEETHKTGKLLDDVHDCVLKPTEESLPADAAWATVLDSLFQLSGVSVSALQAGELPVKKVWHRFLWMLPAIAGAVAIIFLFGKSATLLPRLTSFAPYGIAIFVLAECVTLHSLALAVRSLQLPAEDRKSLSSSLLKELLAGLVVGVVCGAILLGVAVGTGVTMKFGIYMAGSAAAGMCLSARIGMMMPRLLEKLSAGKWIAPAQMALPSAGLVSVLLYFCVCTFLLA